MCKYEVYKSRFSCKACRSYWVTQFLMRGRLEFQEDLFSYARQHGIMAGLTLGMQTRLFQTLFHSHTPIFLFSLLSFLNLSLHHYLLILPFFLLLTLPLFLSTFFLNTIENIYCWIIWHFYSIFQNKLVFILDIFRIPFKISWYQNTDLYYHPLYTYIRW